MIRPKQSAISSNLDVFAEIIEKHGRAIMEKAVEQVLNLIITQDLFYPH